MMSTDTSKLLNETISIGKSSKYVNKWIESSLMTTDSINDHEENNENKTSLRKDLLSSPGDTCSSISTSPTCASPPSLWENNILHKSSFETAQSNKEILQGSSETPQTNTEIDQTSTEIPQNDTKIPQTCTGTPERFTEEIKGQNEENTKQENVLRRENDIKEEVLADYSVDGWCELGPSAHAQGHSPGLPDLDQKEDIKDSPRSDDMERTSLPSDNNHVVDAKVFPALADTCETKPDSSLFASGTGTHKHREIISDGNKMDYSQVAESNTLNGVTTHLSYERGSQLESSSQNDLKTESEKENPVKKETPSSPRKPANMVHSPSGESQQQADQNFNHHQNRLKTTQNSPTSPTIANQPVQMLPISPVFTAFTSTVVSPRASDVPLQSCFPVTLGQMMYTPSPSTDRMSVNSYPYPSFVLQHSNERTPPFISQDIGNIPKLQQPHSEPFKLFQAAGTTTTATFHYTTMGDQPFGQPGITPSTVGYLRYPSSPHNSDIVFLSPQSLLFQQLPYMPVFHRSTQQQPCQTFPPDIKGNEQNSKSGVTPNSPTKDCYDLSTNRFTKSPNETTQRKICVTERDAPMVTGDGSGNMDSNHLNQTQFVELNENNAEKTDTSYKRIENISNLDVKVCESIDPGMIDKQEKESATGESKLKDSHLDIKSVDDDNTTSLDEKGGEKGAGRKHTITAKMAGGDDFVDPTQIALGHDDDIDDSDAFDKTNDDTSDEDWMPQKRDTGKSYDNEKKSISADNNSMFDETEEEEEEEQEEEEIGVVGKKWLGNNNNNIFKFNSRKRKQLSNSLECQDCGKVFHGSYHLKRHRLSHTENRPHQCSTCGKKFKQKAHLQGHETVHLREKAKTKNKRMYVDIKSNLSPNKCPGRPKKIYSEKELSCNVCSKVFKTLYRLKRHVQSHTDIRPYTCKVCGKGFKQTGHRNEHEANHEKNRRKFLCNMCGVIFRCRSSFNNHLKTHRFNLKGKTNVSDGISLTDSQSVSKLDDKDEIQHTGYDCPYCTDKFATAQGLNRHLESHIEVRQRLHVQPYSCQVCCRSFTYKHNLTKHMLTHQAPEKYAEFHKSKLEEHLASGKPSYTCAVCSKVFIRKETLAKHLKIHTGSKPFKCFVCNKEFTQNVHMKVHMRKHTGNRPFQCKRCNRGFIDSTALAKHIEYEACNTENVLYHCNICDKRHYYLGSIKQHIKKEHHKTNVDKFITRTQRQRRQRITNEKTDTCKICSTFFSEKGNLIRHVKRKHGDLIRMLNDDLSHGALGELASQTFDWEENTMSRDVDMKERHVDTATGVNTIKEQEPAHTLPTPPSRNETHYPLCDNKLPHFPMNKTGAESLLTVVNNFDKVDTQDTGVSVSFNQDIQPPCINKENHSKDEVNVSSMDIPLSMDIPGLNCNNNNNNNKCTPLDPITTSHSVLISQRPDEDRNGVDRHDVTVSSSGINPQIITGTDDMGNTNTSNIVDDIRNDNNDNERNDRIDERNVSRFLYHVGLVEKVKATKIESPPINDGKENSNPRSLSMSQIMSGTLENQTDVRYDFCLQNQLIQDRSFQVLEEIDGFQNHRASCRTNLEVFCDVALMAEKRNIYFSNQESRSTSSSENNKSPYLNEFQMTVDYNQEKEKIRDTDSGVTESQLRELGLLVCKDAQMVKNNKRPSEEIYAEFRPWLEQLVGYPSTRHQMYNKSCVPASSSSSGASKTNSKQSVAVSETYSKTQIEVKTNNQNRNPFTCDKDIDLQSTHGDIISRSKDQIPARRNDQIPARRNDQISASVHNVYNLGHGAKPTPRSRNRTSDAMIYTHPGFSTPAMNLIHSTNLRQQCSSYGQEYSINRRPLSIPIPVTTLGKAEVSVQTPLYMGSPSFQTSFDCQSNVPLRSVADESKILHSLLGGMKLEPTSALYLGGDAGKHCDTKKKNAKITSDDVFVQKLLSESASFIPANPMKPLSPYHMTTRGKGQGPTTTKGPFPCQGCGKCFNARHQLKRHEMTHTEIRPYSCAECGKAFRQKVHLSDHLKRHRGQRPFLCQACGKRFVLKNELKQHIKNYCRKEIIARTDNTNNGDGSTSAVSAGNAKCPGLERNMI